MKRREDIYNLGNDYFQKTDVYFVTADADAEASAGVAGYKAYSDGLFHFTTQPVYELSGGVSALNKRIFNIPQEQWEPLEGLEVAKAEFLEKAREVTGDKYYKTLSARIQAAKTATAVLFVLQGTMFGGSNMDLAAGTRQSAYHRNRR